MNTGTRRQEGGIYESPDPISDEGSCRIPIGISVPAVIIIHIWNTQVRGNVVGSSSGSGVGSVGPPSKASPARSEGSEGASGPDSGV